MSLRPLAWVLSFGRRPHARRCGCKPTTLGTGAQVALLVFRRCGLPFTSQVTVRIRARMSEVRLPSARTMLNEAELSGTGPVLRRMEGGACAGSDGRGARVLARDESIRRLRQRSRQQTGELGVVLRRRSLLPRAKHSSERPSIDGRRGFRIRRAGRQSSTRPSQQLFN